MSILLAHNAWRTPRQTGWRAFRMEQHWVLDLIRSGQQLQREADDAPTLRESGSLVLRPPGAVYSEYDERATTLEVAYMVFAVWPAADTGLRALLGPRGVCRVADPAQILTQTLVTIGGLSADATAHGAIMRQGLALQVIGLLLHATERAPGEREILAPSSVRQTLGAQVRRYLAEHQEEPLRVADLAQHLSLSESAFAHAYVQETGVTPYQAILRSKVDTAKHLLLVERLSVQDTAKRLSFSTPFNFSRAFKRVEGCSPSQFLRRAAQA